MHKQKGQQKKKKEKAEVNYLYSYQLWFAVDKVKEIIKTLINLIGSRMKIM